MVNSFLNKPCYFPFMISLGIESTAHTLGVGIIDDKGKILADARATYRPKEGGIIPTEAAEFMAKNAKKTILEALDQANLDISDIDVIAFSKGPGMQPQLRVGAVAARTLSLTNNIPIVGVNHCIAHLEISRLFGAKDPVMLYVSGGNTQVIAFNEGKFRVFGETEDIGLGNFLDVIARDLGLGFPGGPLIEELAKKGKNYIELPYTVKGMDITLGGILTYVRNLVKKGGISIEDLCYSIQETVFAMVIEISERAIAHLDKEEFIITGGVAANERLREMGRIMCEQRGCKFIEIPKKYCVDNGVMIAWLGILVYKSKGSDKLEDTKIDRYWRIEDVEVTWR